MKIFFRASKMTFGLVDVGHSLPKGQAVKLIFFVLLSYGCTREVAKNKRNVRVARGDSRVRL